MDFREALWQPFPKSFRKILRAYVPFYARLSAHDRESFEEKLKVFVSTKEFLDTDGMRVDATVKVVIAATACRISLNIPGEHYGRLRTVVVFPSFVPSSSGTTMGTAQRHLVELSWEHVLEGLEVSDDGDNVGYHEFAHVLDASDGRMDGQPPLFLTPSLCGTWGRVLAATMESLRTDPASDHLFPIRARSNAEELFACATELFFEKPLALVSEYPDLYRILSKYYRQHPAAEYPGEVATQRRRA